MNGSISLPDGAAGQEPADAELSVVYVSEATQSFESSDLAVLADLAERRNLELGVTGYLYHANNRFVQYLEGPAESVRSLLHHIQGDHRHRVLTVAWEDRLESRRFPDWGMRWLREFELKEISLEELLVDHLLFSSKAALQSPSIDATVRRMVIGIAERRSKLTGDPRRTSE